ncbi:hypothetical protein FB451DRAFT_1015405 [Mycena latifolia]|nr:hypothetical protein FB451DRAFT_1015405 [Mycena latifolia]
MDSVLDEIIQTNQPPSDLQAREIQRMLDVSRAQFSSLEETILTVSLVLAELERQRDLQRQYVTAFKRALSPIRCLPAEILAEIFMLCRNTSLQSETYSIADPREAPMLLGHISSQWRTICHGTPLLWDHVHFTSLPRRFALVCKASHAS